MWKVIALLLLFIYAADGYLVYKTYKDKDCGDLQKTSCDDGECSSGKCYESGTQSFKYKCEGGDLKWAYDKKTKKCEEDKYDQDSMSDKLKECTCDGKCCETSSTTSVKCYCDNYKKTDQMWLAILILAFIPCCWIGCICILCCIGFIVCCACGTGGCFGNL